MKSIVIALSLLMLSSCAVIRVENGECVATYATLAKGLDAPNAQVCDASFSAESSESEKLSVILSTLEKLMVQ